jgi:hypothetical protein
MLRAAGLTDHPPGFLLSSGCLARPDCEARWTMTIHGELHLIAQLA